MKKTLFAILLSLFFLSTMSQEVFAVDTTMSLYPQSGSFGKPFTVNLVIDGHGERFNAAQATVSISQGLTIKDLVLGDCNFSYLKTPSVQNPSFEGVILAKYNTKCTVYTITVIPVVKGSAAISLKNTSVRRYGDAASILYATQNASYTLTAAVNAQSVLSDKTSKKDLYAISVKIFSTGDNPVSNAIVTLNPVSEKDQVKAATDSKGIAHFSNIKTGVYSLQVERNKNKVAETIISVSGSNHVLTFGINLEAQKNNNPLLKNSTLQLNSFSSNPLVIVGILLLGIILSIIIAVIFTKLKRDKLR